MPNFVRKLDGWGRLKPPTGCPLQQTHPLANGLVGGYLLGEGSFSSALDLHYNIYPLTTVTAVKPSPGIFGKPARLFASASSSQINNGTGGSPVAAYPLSLVAWGYINTTPAAGATLLAVQVNGATSNCRISVTNTRTPEAGSQLVATSAVATSPSAVAVNAPFQVVGVFTSATLRAVYVNGVKAATNTTSIASAVYNEVLIGNAAGSGGLFDGVVDHGLIYNRALSDAEVEWLFHEPFVMFAPRAPRRIFSFRHPVGFRAAWVPRQPVLTGGCF